MKKKLYVLLITVIMAISLTACGNFMCDFCGDEKNGKNYKSELWGEEMVICKDCYDELQELFGAY